MTLEAIAVDMKGNRFNPGQIYVALSRVKTFSGLYINPKSIKKSTLVDEEMARRRGFRTKDCATDVFFLLFEHSELNGK